MVLITVLRLRLICCSVLAYQLRYYNTVTGSTVDEAYCPSHRSQPFGSIYSNNFESVVVVIPETPFLALRIVCMVT